MFLLFAAEPNAADDPEDQPSAIDKAKVLARQGAENAGPVLKKAASSTLAAAKKAGAAGLSLFKKVTDRARDEIAKRRGGEAGAGKDEPVVVETAATEEQDATDKTS